MKKQNFKNVKIELPQLDSIESAEKIETKLLKLKGVTNVTPDVGKKLVDIEFDVKKIKLEKLIKTIQQSGFDVSNKNIVITIGDMGCLGCTGVIRNSLKLLDGVIYVDVDFAQKKATLTYNASLTGLKDIKDAIERAGHQYIINVEGEGFEDEDLTEIITNPENSSCFQCDNLNH